MRAEGPKERPTAVLCVQLSACYVQIRQTAKIRNTTPLRILHYHVLTCVHLRIRTYVRIHAARATGIRLGLDKLC